MIRSLFSIYRRNVFGPMLSFFLAVFQVERMVASSLSLRKFSRILWLSDFAAALLPPDELAWEWQVGA